MAGHLNLLLACLIIFVHGVPTLQDCSRPAVSSSVILNPDKSSYLEWEVVVFSCPAGYSASTGSDYSYCFSGSPDYWYPEMNDVLTCTQGTAPFASTPQPITDSCGGFCCGINNAGECNTGGCWCDYLCLSKGDCCNDFLDVCTIGEALVFVADYTNGVIAVANLTNTEVDSLNFNSLPLSNVEAPIAVDYYPNTRTLFWTETSGSIRRCDIDGSNAQVIANSSLTDPYGLALDAIDGKVYWTDASYDCIESAYFDGSMRQTIIGTDLDKPRALVIHQATRTMFWSDWGSSPKIERADLDGFNREIIVNTSIVWPNGLAFNSEGTRLYWCDASYDRIESVDFWGYDRRIVLDATNIHPFDLAIVGDDFLWTDWTYRAIGSFAVNDGNYSMLYQGVFSNPQGIHIYIAEDEQAPPTLSPWTPGQTTAMHWNPVTDWRTTTMDADPTTDGQINPGWTTERDRTPGWPGWPTTERDSTPSGPGWQTTERDNNPGWTTDTLIRTHQTDPQRTDHPEPWTNDPHTPPTSGAHVVCDSTSMTLIMERSLLDVDDGATDIHFSDETCVGYDHDSNNVAITTQYDQCGTTQQQEEDHIVFSNTVTYYEPRPVNGTNQVITREHFLHIPVRCYLDREQLLGESFKPQVGAIPFVEVGYGDFTLSLERYDNIYLYNQAEDSSLVRLGEPLYFGVNLTTVTDLTLLIESCWATPSAYPLDQSSYVMIDDGCAKDHTVGFINNRGPTLKGFQVDAFTFIGDYEQVFVHCTILICDNGDPGSRCSQGCVSRTRRSLQPTGSRSKPHTISNGPLSAALLQANVEHDGDGNTSHSANSVTIAAIGSVGIFIALIILIALMTVRRRTRLESRVYHHVNIEVPNDE